MESLIILSSSNLVFCTREGSLLPKLFMLPRVQWWASAASLLPPESSQGEHQEKVRRACAHSQQDPGHRAWMLPGSRQKILPFGLGILEVKQFPLRCLRFSGKRTVGCRSRGPVPWGRSCRQQVQEPVSSSPLSCAHVRNALCFIVHHQRPW